MKTFFTFLIALFSLSTFAADLFVQEFGGGGTYSTINDAFVAASAGDRILIRPKSANAPYIESLTINKSIQLLTATNGSRFYMQGSITVSATLSSGSFLVIDGVQITSGSIIQTTASTNAVDISIVNSVLQNGTISFGQRFNVLVANNTISSTSTSLYTVKLCKGNVLGNTINGTFYGVEYNTDAFSTTDTLYMIGNRITISGNFSSGMRGLDWANSSYFFYIANNHFIQSGTTFGGLSSASYALLRISGVFKPGINSNQGNTIVNNTLIYNVTIIGNSASTCGIEGLSLDNRCSVFNNLIVCNQTNLNQSGFNLSGTPQVIYNNVSNASFNAGSVSSSGNTLQSVTVNPSGCLTSNLDLGHPNPIFTDLDLTRNDWGACGGSFNISVNYPTSLAGTAKVHLLRVPRRILQGGVFSINADGHDR